MANNQSTKQCKHCRSDIDSKAKICPVCKKKQGGGCSTALYIFLGIAGLGVISSILHPSGSKPADDTPSRTSIEATVEETAPAAKVEATEAPKAENTKAPEEATEAPAPEAAAVETEAPATEAETLPPATEAPPADDLSIGQKNALRSAISYIDIMPFSASGLIEQLEYEGYSHEDAVYAVEHCGADWNEQAAKDAKSYIEMMPFSRDSLIEQLVYDGYTQEQAEYGASAVGY